MTKPYAPPVPFETVLASFTPDERQEIETRARETTLEIDGLKALRLLLEQRQKQIAQSLGIKQHAVHKMKKANRPLSLRRFVEAAGGKFELVIDMPGRMPIRLTGIGDLAV